jgi:hypothetical protein
LTGAARETISPGNINAAAAGCHSREREYVPGWNGYSTARTFRRVLRAVRAGRCVIMLQVLSRESLLGKKNRRLN